MAHELSHTLQQDQGIQRQAEAEGSKSAGVSSEIVNLSSNTFKPSQRVKDEIDGQGDKGLDVRVQAKGLTGEGKVKIKGDKGGTYKSVRRGSMPLLNLWTQQLGGMYINFSVRNDQIQGGYASLTPGGGNAADWLQTLKKNSNLLGGLGLQVNKLPTPVNTFENGKLTLGVNGLKVEVGGFVDAAFNISLENISKPKIDATADINVKGIAKGQLKLNNAKDKLAGEVSLAIDFKSFNGNANIKYNPDGTVEIGGTAGYTSDKLSGEIQFVATDLKSAQSFARDAIAAAGGKKNVQNAPPPAPVPTPKPGTKQLALAATGQLGFNLTDWFAGTVDVVVDSKGAVTVIGKIAPPAEIELFKQRDWDKQLVQFEAKAYYGIPLVGNLNLFANISLHALAKLGPAKLYQIEILGTYSTDPDIQKNIQISASINISAYAGLRLRAEGGAGVELVGHDLKFGIGLNADIGAKAYADARPTIGYRDPGVFYISGTLEMVAQPMFGLGGDFFIELDSPWWSPAPDEKWTWPLFEKEWPLSDPIGLSATIKDYILGSGVVPEIEMKKPEFDPSKFMTSMVDDKLPAKSGGKTKGKGTFKEDGSVPKPDVQSKKPAAKKADVKSVKKKGATPKGGKSAKPDKKAASAQNANKILRNSLEGLKNKAPYSQAELKKALGSIKRKVKGISFKTQEQGDKWIVTPSGGGKKKSAGKIELAMKKGGAVSEEAKKGLAALDQVTERYAAKGATKEEMTAAVKSVRRKFKFKRLEVKQEGDFWHYHYEINPEGDKKGPKNNIITPQKVLVGSWVKNLKNGGFERVTKPEGSVFLRKGGKGGKGGEIKILSFLTSRVDGSAGSFSYNQEGKDWERTDFTHPSKYVMIEGTGAKFILQPSYQGRKYIRPNFYNDTSGNLDEIRNRKLSKLVHPLDPNKFLSEGDATAEAAEGYTQTFKGKAVVPNKDASPDHDPPVSEHWTSRKGNNTTQSTREAWNNSLNTYKLMSWPLNRRLGSRGASYTEQVGINFRGPKDK
ncbi:MAG: hypothetical protein Q3M30_17365 [Candidatus Electrothrix sp. Rat3]|nr:hypothetical protein [Candidatus Electrothrix rattekaaiensis]